MEIKNRNELHTYYKDHEIIIERESDDEDWYILVQSDNGISYDGWWRDSYDKTIDEAFEEALRGACLNE